MSESTNDKVAKKAGGRPRIDINWEEFDKLCSLQCTLDEVAMYFDCSPDTIERRVQEKYDRTWTEVYDEKRGAGKIAIRRKQFQVALRGNVRMLIWLGKQWLGQRDMQDIDATHEFRIVRKVTDGD